MAFSAVNLTASVIAEGSSCMTMVTLSLKTGKCGPQSNIFLKIKLGSQLSGENFLQTKGGNLDI